MTNKDGEYDQLFRIEYTTSDEASQFVGNVPYPEINKFEPSAACKWIVTKL